MRKIMPFPWTLQGYIFREMGKTFLLAAIALTGVLGLGGGLLQMMKLGETTPGQVIRIMALLLPISASLTLPIAALFSAAATYGRLSADNEFVACRSSGINMHVLLLPTVALSLLAASASFGLTNYMIPGMVRNLNEVLRADLGKLIQQRLNQPRGLTLADKYRIHADEFFVNPSDPNEITLSRVAFAELDDGRWVRYGTAREIRLRFALEDQRVRVSGRMTDLSYYDQKLDRFVEEASQIIPTNESESPVPQKIKFLNLNELIHYLSAPTEWHEVRDEIEGLRKAVGAMMLFESLRDQWRRAKSITLQDERTRFVIRAEAMPHDPNSPDLEVTGVHIDEYQADRERSIVADRATFKIVSGATLGESGLVIEVHNARLSVGGTTIERVKTTLDMVHIPTEIIDRVSAISVSRLLDPPSATSNEPLEQKRFRAKFARGATVRRITAAINERTAFSISVLMLSILGAVLGIVLRGSHLMTAFGISFVPMLFVIIMIVTGKQMAHNPGTHGLGLLVIWSGIMVVVVLDIWILTRVLRR